MDYLLDTHIIIWAIYNDPSLSDEIKAIIRNKDNNIFYSAASLWEIEIKHNKNPESVPASAFDIFSVLLGTRLEFIDISIPHIHCLRHIIPQNIHKDPFDHMILATAKREDLTLITHDKILKQYQGVNVLTY